MPEQRITASPTLSGEIPMPEMTISAGGPASFDAAADGGGSPGTDNGQPETT
jgi:hypothetical protein